MDWCVVDRLAADAQHGPGQLHCVDNLAHAHTTAHLVQQGARSLGLDPYLQLHEHDAWAFHEQLGAELVLDLVWVDFGAGERLDEFFGNWWARVPVGGLLLVHSTLTNQLTRRWLDRKLARQGPPLGDPAPPPANHGVGAPTAEPQSSAGSKVQCPASHRVFRSWRLWRGCGLCSGWRQPSARPQM